jgi:hypothetical protein
MKEMCLDLDAARIKRRIQINVLEEMRLTTYENAIIDKERIKRWYDKRLKRKSSRKQIKSFSIVDTIFWKKTGQKG